MQAFSSRLLGRQVTGNNPLEGLVTSGWVGGLPNQEIEAALAETLGPKDTLSRSILSRICEGIKAEFQAWRDRDLSRVDLHYVMVDASHLEMQEVASSEPMLMGLGDHHRVHPPVPHLDGVSAESTDAFVAFLALLLMRALSTPAVVTVKDGAPRWVGPCTDDSPTRADSGAWPTGPEISWPRSPSPTRRPSRLTCESLPTCPRTSPR